MSPLVLEADGGTVAGNVSGCVPVSATIRGVELHFPVGLCSVEKHMSPLALEADEGRTAGNALGCAPVAAS